jgi:hypothetical protein
MIAAFPEAAASRQRIAQASLEKAPKIDGVYLLARLQRLVLAVLRRLGLTWFLGSSPASSRMMKVQGIILFLLVAGLGMYSLRFCSNRFMMLRRSKSFTPYLYGIGGILSLMLITLAFFAMLLVFLGPLH